MTYPPGGASPAPGYPGAQQSAPYAPTTQFAKADDRPSRLPVYLLAAVAVLGLAAYLLSFGPVWQQDAVDASGVVIFGVIAALFAALFAVVAMLPKQSKHTGVVTATSVVGFLLVIWSLIRFADGAGWALIAIVVVTALQTIAAIGALLLGSGVISPPSPRPKYDPYQQQYGGGYYGQFGQPQQGGMAQGGTHQQHTQSFGQPQGYSQFGGYGGSQPPTGGFAAQDQSGPPTPPTGFPTYSQPPGATSTTPGQHSAPEPAEKPGEQAPAEPQSSSPSGPPPS
ncbi:MAG TPA: DUF5336 domain-containing protein [Mycobacterium sp.]|jgi:hypothetical protein